MKLFIISKSENGINNIDGTYYLMTEEAEIVTECEASSLFFARYALYENNEEIKKLCHERYGKDHTVEFLKFATRTEAVRVAIENFNI